VCWLFWFHDFDVLYVIRMHVLTDYSYVGLFDLRVKQRSVCGDFTLVVAGHVSRQVGQRDRVVVRLGYLNTDAREHREND